VLSLCQLYEDERQSSSQLQTQLADVHREMSDLRLELDRLRNSTKASSVTTADINNERRVMYEHLAAEEVLIYHSLVDCIRY